jgi:tRNA (cmo5U34)-methyltransferase
MHAFSDPQAVARYAEAPPRLVPGFADLQRMIMLLLAERAPDDARVLVLGAGGGLEIKAFAEAKPGWLFDGVDPSAEMMSLAQVTLGSHGARTVRRKVRSMQRHAFSPCTSLSVRSACARSEKSGVA